ncbi:synaptotagmin-like protein 3 isoform X2 [Triplophysa rosa]|uniref:synaptotagmin-like protein 3 isoform X2 n=1 Tax=Triplophysa rosa TaxID=992332 RepID=UPI002545F140|nr:synaptotagmin-like protein 3 isoform X2 [Triplophysa rosa]
MKNLELFQALERERVLEVLRRDKALRSIEAERIRRLRTELQNICGQGTRSFARPYGQRSCARCQRVLGQFWDCGSVCCGCSHRICDKCRVVRSAQDWKCTVCHAYREFKIKSGEWFLEQQAKKFPEENRQETTGDKLLQSYQQFSCIRVVPPTPPPFYEAPVRNSFHRLEGRTTSKPFTKSMENLMASVSTHIKKLSKSQNDLSMGAGHLTVVHALTQNPGWKSQSEGAIDKACNLCKVPSLPNLSQKMSSGTDQSGSASLTDDNVSHTSEYSHEQLVFTFTHHHFFHLITERTSFRKQKTSSADDSNSSTSMDLGTFENTSSVSGEIQVAIGYKTSCLEITVKACKNLMHGDMKKRKCHPYVNICLLPKKNLTQKMKTTVKTGNNPVYNETFTCVVAREHLVTSVLHMSVWHTRGLKKKVFLGETLIRLENTDHLNSVWYTLAPKHDHPLGGDVDLYTSQLILKVKFLPQTDPHTDDSLMGTHGQLVVLICDVSKLQSMSKTSYIEGILCLSGDRVLVQRSPALKKTAGTLQMNFNRLMRQDLQQATLLFSLWEKGSLRHGKRLLRSAQLCAGSSWQRLQQMPGVWHDYILPLHADVNMTS